MIEWPVLRDLRVSPPDLVCLVILGPGHHPSVPRAVGRLVMEHNMDCQVVALPTKDFEQLIVKAKNELANGAKHLEIVEDDGTVIVVKCAKLLTLIEGEN